MDENDSSKAICPVDRAIQLLNKKWNIQIIRDLFFGKKHFNEFKEDKPDLSNKVLSQCLKDLENNGLIEKKVIATQPNATEYCLTEKGLGLNKVIYELAIFTLEKCDFDDYKDEGTRGGIRDTFRSTLNIE